MKRFLTLLVIIAMFLTLCIPASATSAAPAEDVTDRIKVATAFDIYENKLPVVRMDAQFMAANEYTNDPGAEGWKAPGTGNREILIYGDTGWTNLFNDAALTYLDYEAAWWTYECIWSHIADPLTYTFTVPADGNYEFVIAGCAEIKEENVGDNAKDRGFCISVDGGSKVQVNIADTVGAFRGYYYQYAYEDLKAGLDKVATENGANSQYYQMTYYYGEGLTMYLTAGTHTFEYWPLEYSGDVVFGTGDVKVTASRLNYYGTYVQPALSEGELNAYVFSDATTYAPKPEETPAPDTTTPEETTAEPVDDPTTAEEGTPAPEVSKDPETSKTPDADNGCGGLIGGGAVLLTALCATGIIIRRRK